MADGYYGVSAVNRLGGVSGTDELGGVSGLENLGAAANRTAGRAGGSYNVDAMDGVHFSSSYQPSPQGLNATFGEMWQAITRGDHTYYFSSNPDAAGRYQAAAEAKANETVASFNGDIEDVREIRDRLLKGESLDSVLNDVKEKRSDLNVAAAVARNKSNANASVNNDIVDPNIKEASAVADARDGSTANASAGKESRAAAVATDNSVAGATSDQNSDAGSVARKGSQAVSSAFEQSLGFAKAKDGSEATVSASNGATAEADADHSGVSRSEARNDARAMSRARAGDAHAEATDGSMAQAESSQKNKYQDFKVGKDDVNTVWGALKKAGWSDEEIVKQNLVDKTAHENKLKDPGVVHAGQKLHIEQKPQNRPDAEAIGRNRSEADAKARGSDAHSGILADDGAAGSVHTGPHESKDIKVAPQKTGSLPNPETYV